MSNQEIGSRVFEERKKQGLSQSELAERAGISRNYVSLIERGEATNVSVAIVNKLATALSVPPATLLGQDQPSNTLIPQSLREFGLQEGLSYPIVDKLARLPLRGKEPETVEEWKTLYNAISQYLEESE
jgi:transcriptional regulator with XRE-family HTH domain